LYPRWYAAKVNERWRTNQQQAKQKELQFKNTHHYKFYKIDLLIKLVTCNT
jgi:hypothetical protein